MWAFHSQTLTGLAFLLSQVPVSASTPSAVPKLPRHTVAQNIYVPGMIATLRTDGRDYKVGQPVLLQLAVENHGRTSGYLYAPAPEFDFRLEITGPDGQVVQPDPRVDVPNPKLRQVVRTMPGELRPGAVAIESYDGRTWTDIRAWHYDLRETGNYRITAFRKLVSPEIPSNTVVVTMR